MTSSLSADGHAKGAVIGRVPVTHLRGELPGTNRLVLLAILICLEQSLTKTIFLETYHVFLCLSDNLLSLLTSFPQLKEMRFHRMQD